MTKDPRDETAHSHTVLDLSTRPTTATPASVAVPSGAARALVAGRYEILNLLGEGGMGSVYRARDTVLDEIVAFKVLRHELAASPELIERFKREVKLARRVTHPNVARMFDIGEHEGTTFLTMEFIDGEPLTSFLERQGALPVEAVTMIAAEVCAGLAAAHKAGVVHRDLKPDNVMMGPNRKIAITDFGIAREGVASQGTVAGLVVGTPAYMAPEQVEARGDIDARADIYALGVMLFELLTGTLPFSGTSAFTLAAARLTEAPPDPKTLRSNLPAGIAKVVLKCMARNRDERYSDAEEVAAALAQSTPTLGQGVSAIPPAPARAVEPVHSHDKTVAVLPFRNLGPADDDYVAEGVTEDLIDTLSMTSGLRVRPRGAVIGFKGIEKDPRDIGRELGVQVVVEGSVRRTPTAVRLNARLLSVEDGFQLWASRFDRPANDLLVMSDETAAAIAKALTVHEVARGRVAADASAIDLYLKARSELHRVWPQNALKAMEYLKEAHERAPDDMAILGAYVRACGRVWFFGGEQGEAAGVLGRALADKAMAAAPDDPHVLLGVGSIRLLANDWIGAANVARRAFDRAPASPEAVELRARLRLEAGQIDQALVELEAALALEPMLVNSRMDRTRAHALLGNYERARDLMDADIALDDTKMGNGVLRSRLAFWSPVIADTLDKVVIPDDFPPNTPWAFASAMKTIYVTSDLDAYLPLLETLPKQIGSTRRAKTLFQQIIAEFAVFFGRNELALKAVEDAVDEGLFDSSWAERCPVLEPIRNEPRFQAALAIIRERGEEVLYELDG